MKLYLPVSVLILAVINFSCATTKPAPDKGSVNHLKLLDEYNIPYNTIFKNTVIGGLSGIDYNAAGNIYYMISDDRSDKNPARFYEAQIIINKNRIDSVVFKDVKFLKNSSGNYYPNSRTDPYHTPDPEALRYNPTNNTFVWSSEGERIVRPGKLVLEDPSVTEINADGKYIDSFKLPPQLQMQSIKSGPRQNSVFEGLTFSENYKSLFVSVEEPLYNDGSRAGLNDSTGITRILKFDMDTKKPIAQYAYILDPVAYAPTPLNGFRINGIPDILSLGENKVLVIERSYSTGRLACTIKVFIADVSSAENIQEFSSVKNKSELKTVSKKLLLNMDKLGIYIDNIEGVTFGPTLPNGKRSLLFVADNNFNPLEKTQILLFEIE
ncbi:MAG TPA: esterase-like activity of phytase family protein [Ginsengibacter sp.]|nr:esterase-like activity of phytase family protein [Ginsengibacter sp.]